MKARRQLFALNLALLLLLSLLPVSALAEETLEAGQFSIGGELLTPESNTTYTGQGWTFRKSGQNKLTLTEDYNGAPIRTVESLTITLEGAATVSGGIYSGGYLTLSCNDPAAGLTVTNDGGPAIQASQLNLSFNCGTLTARGTQALAVTSTLTLPSVKVFDDQSANVVQRAGDSAASAVPVSAYSGEAYYHWSLTECEVVFSPNGGQWPADTSAYRFTVPYGKSVTLTFPAAPSRPGCLFRGWSVLSSGGVNLYQPGATVSPSTSRVFLPYYADWAEVPETGVIYHGNGGTVGGSATGAAVVAVSGAAEDAVELTNQGFSAKYHTFAGWSLTPTGSPVESLTLTEGQAIELYAVWTKTQSASSGGTGYSLTTGPLAVDDTVVSLPYTGGSGTGWSGTPANLTLTGDYGGAPLETAYDLCLHIDGQVTISGRDGAAIHTGGKLLLDFTAGSSLTVTGGGSAPAIRAGELILAAPGAMTATGGTGAPALSVSGTCDLSRSADGSAVNDIRAGSDAANARDTTYTGQHFLSVSRPSLLLTYDANDGSGRAKTVATVLQTPVTLTGTPAFTREGYVLLGWTLAGDDTCRQEGDAVSAITGPATLYAVWGTDSGADIILDGNGRAWNGQAAVTLPLADGAATLPEAEGLVGWSLNRSYQLPEGAVTDLLWPGESYTLAPGTRLYAVWSSTPYLTFHGNGGVTAGGGTIARAPSLEAAGPDLFTREGALLGWWEALDDSETVYQAHWVTSGVICHGNGGTCGGAEAIQAEGLPADSAGFTRPGYDFLGWGLTPTDDTPLTELPDLEGPVRLYALWQALSVRLHQQGGTKTLLPDEKGMVDLPAWTTGFWYTNAFNGWNTEPDGSGTWYARGARIRPTASLDLYPLGTDLSQDHIWLTACYGAFEGQTFRVAATSLEENTIFFPGTLPVKADMEVEETALLAWWYDSSIYADGGYAPRPAIAPGTTVENWSSRTLFRGILDTPNTASSAWAVQNLQGGTTAEGYPLVVSYASLGDLRLADTDMVFKEGCTLTGWNTEPDGSGTAYEPGHRFLYDDYAFHWDGVPRKLYAMWEGAEAVFHTVTLTSGNSSQTVSAAEGGLYTLPALTQCDLRFDGWNTEPDGSGTAYAAGSQLTVTGDLTLYAQWTAPDLVLTVPETMLGIQDGMLYAALYRDGRLVALRIAEPDGSIPFYDVPENTESWQLFCLDDRNAPLTEAASGTL